MQKTSLPSNSPEFDLSVFKKINPALVYAFETEGSLNNLDPKSIDALDHAAGQWLDMFSAYYYVEFTILPAIQNLGIANITPSQLLLWLNELHFRIASTLAIDANRYKVELASPLKQENYKEVAGEYIKGIHWRWRNGGIISDIIDCYLSRDINILKARMAYIEGQKSKYKVSEKLFGEFEKITDYQKKFIKLLQAFGVEEHDAKEFLELYDRIYLDDSIKLTDEVNSILNQLGGPQKKVAVAKQKFLVWYYHRNPSDREKAIVGKIVHMVLPPEKMQEAMQDFAEKLLKKWCACDATNSDQVAQLLFFAFKTLAGDIHPYFNANGRLATCLDIIILISLEKSSILIRNPEERDDPNSSYSRAIKQIDSNPKVLIKHLEQRVLAAESGKAYTNLDLAKLISLRVKLFNLITSIRMQFPNADIKSFYESLLVKVSGKVLNDLMAKPDFFSFPFDNPEAIDNYIAKNRDEKVILEFYINEISEFKNNLERQQKISQKPSEVITSRSYTNQEISQIKEKIENILLSYTFAYELKTYSANGLTIRLFLSAEEQRTTLSNFFKETGALTVSLKKDPNNIKPHVLQLDNFNVEKLLKIASIKPVVEKNTGLVVKK